MKKILVVSTLALILTGCTSGSEEPKSKSVVSKETKQEKNVETTSEVKETTTTQAEVNISLNEKDFSAYIGDYIDVSDPSYKMTVKSGGEVRNRLLEPSQLNVVEENGKKYFIASTHVVRIPTKYNLVPAGTEPAPGFETNVKSDASKNRIFTKMEDTGAVGVYEQAGTASISKSEEKVETKTESKSSEKNNSLSSEQSEALAKGMKSFGEKINQVPYEKTDVPEKLTWQSGGEVSGYKIYESYIYKSGGTIHRYFFVSNASGNPEVLYSTGGTSVKHTANTDIAAMFKGVHEGSSSGNEEKTENSTIANNIDDKYLGTYTSADGETEVIEKYKDGVKIYNPKTMSKDKVVTYWGVEDGEFKVKNQKDVTIPTQFTWLEAGEPTPANLKGDGYKSDEDDENKHRLVHIMPGGGESFGKIYLKNGESKAKKEETETENKSSKSKLDIDAIAKGDLSSAMGTYTSKAGKSYTITKNEIISNNEKLGEYKISKSSKEGNVGKLLIEPKVEIKGPSSGGGFMVFVPAGVNNPIVNEYGGDTNKLFPEIDTDRDRVFLLGNGFSYFYID